MILASTPRPGLVWEPAQGLANPFVFSATAANVAAGDLMQWDRTSASARCYPATLEVVVIPTTAYVHSTRTVTSVTAFPTGQAFNVSGFILGLSEMVITKIGSLVDIEIGDSFPITSTPSATTIVLDAPGLGADNDAVANDWEAEIRLPLDERHPLNFWTPTAATPLNQQKRNFYGVAEKSLVLTPSGDFAASVDFPRMPITMSGFTQVKCESTVLAGDFLMHSVTSAGTATRLEAPAAGNSAPVFGKALEDAPSGGGLTWCLFDGFYGFGCTHDPY